MSASLTSLALVGLTLLPSPQVEVIGGTDKYLAVCRKCYFGSSPMNGNGVSVGAEIVSPVKKALFNGAS